MVDGSIPAAELGRSDMTVVAEDLVDVQGRMRCVQFPTPIPNPHAVLPTRLARGNTAFALLHTERQACT